MDINRVVQGGTFIVSNDSAASTKDVEAQVTTQNEQNNQETFSEPIVVKESAQKIVEGLNTVLSASNSHLKFVYHERLQKYFVAIVDNRTEEVIKEIPPRKLLDMVANMNEQIGLIVDQKI